MNPKPCCLFAAITSPLRVADLWVYFFPGHCLFSSNFDGAMHATPTLESSELHQFLENRLNVVDDDSAWLEAIFVDRGQ